MYVPVVSEIVGGRLRKRHLERLHVYNRLSGSIVQGAIRFGARPDTEKRLAEYGEKLQAENERYAAARKRWGLAP